MFTSSREVAAAIGELIHAKRPQAGYFNYIQESTDGIMSESNTAVARPLPLWPYSASDNVNRARNSQPGKMPVNLNMQFVDFFWRFATVPREEIALRVLAEHGERRRAHVRSERHARPAGPAGATKPPSRSSAGRRPIEQYYAGQTNAARVLLLGAPADTGRHYSEEGYRGLSACSPKSTFRSPSRTTWTGSASATFDLVIASDWAPAGLRQYAEDGGKLLIASARERRSSRSRAVLRTDGDVKGYIRVRDHAAFPSLKDTDLLMLNGPFTT